ncbi:MAG: DUF2199 domain-containing protein [Aureliella sp.]
MYWDIPEDRRESDVLLTSDSCVIADRFFFVHGCLEIPIHATEREFVWGVWVSLSEENFMKWQDCYEAELRSDIGPFFGWLCNELRMYPSTLNLKTMVYLRNNGIRPRIELEQTDHPLSQEQHGGISVERALELVHLAECTHGNRDET